MPTVLSQVRIHIGVIGKDDLPSFSVQYLIPGLSIEVHGEPKILVIEPQVPPIGEFGKEASQDGPVLIADDPVIVPVPKDQIAGLNVLAISYSGLGRGIRIDLGRVLVDPGGLITIKGI